MVLTLPRRFAWRTTPKAPVAPQPPAEAPLDAARAALVAQILELNPSASKAFLASFRESALRNYLEHLRSAQIPRGRDARWVRPDETAAVMCRERAD